ncbi:hypothetical protein DPMN_003898 [Dreissena polymorpha]|uniref:Uncharacterized protein n=1 Tax=Dreissena polymorpha TaxID=45954 RepID=A0A9D4MQR3_DREPO|nr:hypothetical protein DPMN_003898 [Dreissena polymorpha]
MTARTVADSFANKNVTIEVKLQLISDDGLIAGYYKSGSNNNFSLYLNNGQPRIYIYGRIHAVNYDLASNTWYHIFVAFDIGNKHIDVAIYSANTLAHYQQFISTTSLTFPPEGNLLLGTWEMSPPLQFGSFVGLIGELRIWNIFLDKVKIYSLISNPGLTGMNGLALQYSFLEGLGKTTYDSVTGLSMKFSDFGSSAWIISDKTGVSISDLPCMAQINTERIAECERMFQLPVVTQSCSGLGQFGSSFFLDSCKNDVSYVPALATYLDLCISIFNPVPSPVDQLCNDPDSEHYNILCGHMCMQGTPTRDGCVCHEGFWNWNCDKECPDRTSKGKPCFGNGICSKTSGKCICNTGFNETANCQTCAKPYSEPNCLSYVIDLPDPPPIDPKLITVNVTTTPTTPLSISTISPTGSTESTSATSVPVTQTPQYAIEMKSCLLLGNIDILPFTNEGYKLVQANEFYVLHPKTSNQVEVKIRTVQCGTTICMKSLYIRYQTETVIIDGTSLHIGQRIMVNGKYSQSEAQYFIINGLSQLSITVSAIGTKLGYSLDMNVMFDARGYMASMGIQTSCPQCTYNTLCNPRTDFMKNYTVDDPSTFPELIVSEEKQTLPGKTNESTSTAKEQFTFGSVKNTTVDDQADTSNTGYVKPIVCTGDSKTEVVSYAIYDVFDPSLETRFEISS